MIATGEDVRSLVFGLEVKTLSMVAIGALLESGLVDQLKEPITLDDLAIRFPGMVKGRIESTLGLLVASGMVGTREGKYVLAEGAKPYLLEPSRSAISGEIRTLLMQALAFLDAAARRKPETGWRHTDRALLDAQGAGSAAFPPTFKANLIPTMGDLGERLERDGARFLDVGVGVGKLAISMCRVFPKVKVVGIDPFDTPLAIARENIAQAKLGDRIELRRMGIEELAEENAYDAVWVPSPFMPALVLREAVARAHAALRSGGWLIMPVLQADGPSEGHAYWGMLNELWGGPVLTKDEAIDLVQGFSEVRALERPIAGPLMIVARR